MGSGAGHSRGIGIRSRRPIRHGIDSPSCPIGRTRVSSRSESVRRGSATSRPSRLGRPFSTTVEPGGRHGCQHPRGRGALCAARNRAEARPGTGRGCGRSAALRAPRRAGARLADGDAGRREVPRGPLPGLSRRHALHPDPSPGSLSPAIESMDDPDVAAPADPRRLPPLSPPAADHAAGRAGLAAAGRRPGHQPEPLRGQGGRAAAGRPARLLLLHADALRLAGPRHLPGELVRSAGAPGAGADDALDGSGDGTGRPPAGSRTSWRSRRRSATGSPGATGATAG